MDPDFKPQQPPQSPGANMQGAYGPTPPNTPGVQQPNFQPVKPLKNSKKKFLILAGGAAVLVIGVIIAAMLLSRQPDNPGLQTQNTDQTTTTKPEGPQPASAVSTEQDNNAISQEIGNLNDDEDFPADQLSDDNLDL